MTPEQFIAAALPWAREASAATGVLVSVVLAQWADETDWGGADWSPNNNPGNVGSFDGAPVAKFPSLAAGVTAYIDLMNAPDRPEFGATIRKATTAAAQAELLGAANPVWASGRYDNGSGPGSALVQLIWEHNLTQYDPVSPASHLEEESMFAFENSKGQTVIVGRNSQSGNLQVVTSGQDQNVAGGWSVADVTDAILGHYPTTSVKLD